MSELDAYLPDAERAVTRAGPRRPRRGVAIGARARAQARRRARATRSALSVADASGGAGPLRAALRALPGRPHLPDELLRVRHGVGLPRPRGAAAARPAWPGQANVVEVQPRLDRRHGGGRGRDRRARPGNGYSVSDWRSMNGGLFSALAIQQTTLFLVIGLIVAVSTFNVVATLVMTVQEKKRDIGVLTALGAEPRLLLAGLPRRSARSSAARGSSPASLFGVLVCWVMTRFRLLSFPPGVAEIYFVSYIPFLVRLRDLAAIVGFSALAILVGLVGAGAPRRRGSTSRRRCATSSRRASAVVTFPAAPVGARPARLAAVPSRSARRSIASGISPETIRVGEVAHYVKSNLDGSKPTRVSIFVAAPDRARGRQGREGRHRRGLGPRALRLEALHRGPARRRRDQPRRLGRGAGRRSRPGPRRRASVNVKVGDKTGARRLGPAAVSRLQLRLHEPELRVAAPRRPEGLVHDRRHGSDVQDGRRPLRLPRARREIDVRPRTRRSTARPARLYRISGPGIGGDDGLDLGGPEERAGSRRSRSRSPTIPTGTASGSSSRASR